MISKCPACKRGVSAKETPVGQTKYLCKTHKAELDQWLEGVVGDSSPAHSSPSETQLTLQEDLVTILEHFEDNVRGVYQGSEEYDLICAKQAIEALFQQALTSLKTEMEGMKKDSDVSDYWNGLNLGISECQRVIDGMLK